MIYMYVYLHTILLYTIYIHLYFHVTHFSLKYKVHNIYIYEEMSYNTKFRLYYNAYEHAVSIFWKMKGWHNMITYLFRIESGHRYIIIICVCVCDTLRMRIAYISFSFWTSARHTLCVCAGGCVQCLPQYNSNIRNYRTFAQQQCPRSPENKNIPKTTHRACSRV